VKTIAVLQVCGWAESRHRTNEGHRTNIPHCLCMTVYDVLAVYMNLDECCTQHARVLPTVLSICFWMDSKHYIR